MILLTALEWAGDLVDKSCTASTTNNNFWNLVIAPL